MANQKNVEQIYDCIDETCMLLYEELKTPYLQGLTMACNAIISGIAPEELSLDARTKIESALGALNEKEFDKEETRKAIQLAILKGFKHIRRTNEDITPDTIGLLVTFLLEKLMREHSKLVLFDPLAGTANLLLTVANNLEKTVTPVGVDNNHESCQLALAMFDMLDYEEGVFFQDTFTFRNLIADAITTDFPFSKSIEGKYFPYEVLKYHHRNLRTGGYVVAVIPNDFFEVAGADEFRTIIKDLYNIIGLVKLPDTMFKGLGKSILILQKNEEDVPKIEKVLMAEIPSFQDPAAVNNALIRINNWIQENSEHKRGA